MESTKNKSNFAKNDLKDDDFEEMLKVGLIFKTNDGYKFTHQTFLESFFTSFLNRNFDNPEVVEFLVNVAFIEENYQVIRSFIDNWIGEKSSPELYNIYCEQILNSSVENTTPIRALHGSPMGPH
jgi:hypothetical protein